MARALPVSCPYCGAALKAPAAQASAVCEYCGKTSLISRREGLLQRVKPPPAEVVKAHKDTKVAVEAHSTGWKSGCLFIVLLTMALPTFFILKHFLSVSWVGTKPVLLADVDKDGKLDLVGRVRKKNGSELMKAFSGADGSELWESEVIVSDSGSKQDVLTIVWDAILLHFGDGSIRAFDLRTGRRRWDMLSQGEKIRRICGGPSGTALVKLADRRWLQVTLKDGKAADTELRECGPVWSERDREYSGGLIIHDDYDDLETLRVDKAIQRPGGPIIFLGTKKQGTQVAMAARVDDAGEILWQAVVPKVRPLETSRSQLHFTLGEEALFATYGESGKRPRVTAISIADGSRLWDLEIDEDHPLGGLAYGSGKVYLSQWWHDVRVFDAKTGKLVDELGSGFF